MLKAIILDMDGVIVDSEQYWEEKEPHFLRSILPSWNQKNQKELTGMGLNDIYNHLTMVHGLNVQKEQFMKFYHEIAFDIYTNKVNMYPSVLNFITKAKSSNLKIGVCSSSPKKWIKTVIQRFDLSSYIEKTISSEDIQGKGKPAPDIYFRILKELRVKSHEAIAIEDTINGITAAKAARLYCIGFQNESNTKMDLTKSDQIVEHFSEILNIENLSKKIL
tara:strand:+ start:946 stop:1605 length:660 start_codon:yes stop_codon:yes gene_type:complete